MNWDATTAISTLIISISTLLTFIVVLRKYYKRVKVEREAKHQELIATIKAQTIEKLESKQELEDRFWELEEQRKECRNSREKETNDKFNMIEKKMDAANEKNKNEVAKLSTSLADFRKEMNLEIDNLKATQAKIVASLENFHAKMFDYISNSDKKPIGRRTNNTRKTIIKKP